jgi:hypothetical protein
MPRHSRTTGPSRSFQWFRHCRQDSAPLPSLRCIVAMLGVQSHRHRLLTRSVASRSLHSVQRQSSRPSRAAFHIGNHLDLDDCRLYIETSPNTSGIGERSRLLKRREKTRAATMSLGTGIVFYRHWLAVFATSSARNRRACWGFSCR